MPLRATAFFLAAILASISSSQTAATAQHDQQNSSPLMISPQLSAHLGTACNSGRGIIAHFQYMGSQPLRGYLVVFTLADSTNGTIFEEQSLQDIRDPRQARVTSGEEWTRTSCIEAKKSVIDSVTVSARVDVLDFEDGSTWGPATLRASHQLIGMLNGIDFKTQTTTELKRYVTPIPQENGPFPVTAVQTDTVGPLKIESGVWRDEHGSEMFAMDVTNQSSTAIRGYLLKTTFFDPVTGALIRRFSTKELETEGNPSNYLAPGAMWVADPRKFSYRCARAGRWRERSGRRKALSERPRQIGRHQENVGRFHIYRSGAIS